MTGHGVGRRLLALTVLLALPALADDRWLRLKTAHFEMYTTAEEKTARDAIKYFERVREFFEEAAPVKPPADFPARIIAFKDPAEFKLYAVNQFSTAYFVPGPVRDSIAMQNPAPDEYPTTIHEYVHLVIRHSGIKVPLWLNEGLAEVYSTLKPVKDGVAVGDLIPRHIDVLGKGEWFTLNRLAAVTNSSADYNEASRSGMFYAEGWALAHMLFLSPEYKNNFGKFLAALNQGDSMEAALEAAFAKNENQVLSDLRAYFLRKKLYGTVFLVPFGKSTEAPVVTRVAPYDAELMKADLFTASGHLADATRTYRQLESDAPTRPEAFEGAGYLAIRTGDKDTARQEFTRALALGTSDALLCMQLAELDRDAKQPVTAIAAALDRALQIRPDLAAAQYDLGILKVEMRDFDRGIALLNGLHAVAPAREGALHSALAYADLETGNLDAARAQLAEFRKVAKTAAETQAADRLAGLIEARSKGPAAVKPGEKLARAAGTAIGLRCAAPGSGGMSKLGMVIDGKPVVFDLPEAAAVEIIRHPEAGAEFKCGPLKAFRMLVEYAPASRAPAGSPAPPANPAALLAEPAAGLVRRLEF